ncbi:MAG: hypothetical protein V3U54_03950 [Thermodesulfobacteriota bacterium]
MGFVIWNVKEYRMEGLEIGDIKWRQVEIIGDWEMGYGVGNRCSVLGIRFSGYKDWRIWIMG